MFSSAVLSEKYENVSAWLKVQVRKAAGERNARHTSSRYFILPTNISNKLLSAWPSIITAVRDYIFFDQLTIYSK